MKIYKAKFLKEVSGIKSKKDVVKRLRSANAQELFSLSKVVHSVVNGKIPVTPKIFKKLEKSGQFKKLRTIYEWKKLPHRSTTSTGDKDACLEVLSRVAEVLPLTIRSLHVRSFPCR